MKILFLNLSTLKFDVATPDTQALGGSESCVCYLAQNLARNGHDVSLIARLPEGTPDVVKKVNHFPIAALKDRVFFDHHKFDVIILCNAPIAGPHLRELSPSSLLLLWDHVPPDQPSMQALANSEIIRSLDGIVYVSAWQKGVTEKKFGPLAKANLIGNGLTPSFEAMFSSAKDLQKHKQNRAAYTTIPYRGLPLLLKVMQGLKQETKLDIFSSMKLYQTSDAAYEPLYKEAIKDPRIASHGVVAQSELARHLKSAAFLTYPCICEETYCIAALEAIAAGMKVIATNLGAMETTTMGYADLLSVSADRPEDLISDFRKMIDKNILTFKNQPELWAEQRFAEMQQINQTCSWAVRTKEWERLLVQKKC